jgi:hypothetical protein
MSSHAADQLLDELAPLAYPERMRRMRARATELAAAGTLAEVVDELRTRGVYERRLAALGAIIGRRTDAVTAMLTDPDQQVRGQAMRAATRLGVPAEVLVAVTLDAPLAARRQAVKAMVASRNTAVAERLIEPLWQRWGDVEAAGLLPACGADVAAHWLPRLWHAVARWNQLCRAHPDLVLAEACRQLAGLDDDAARRDWWSQSYDAVGGLVEVRPAAVLDLLERHGTNFWPASVWSRIGLLLDVDTARTINVLTRPELATALRTRTFSRSLLDGIARRDEGALLVLGRALGLYPDVPRGAPKLAALLRTVPPSRREALFDALVDGTDLETAMLADELLRALPRARRAREARRMAELAARSGMDPFEILRWRALLPVDEVRDELVAAIGRSDAEERATAYQLLIGNAAGSGDPAQFTAMLTRLTRLRNDQDPVRVAALTELANCGPRLFDAAAVDALDQLVTDAVEARDVSLVTLGAVRKLAARLLAHHATAAATGGGELVAWSLRALERVAGHGGPISLGRLDRELRGGQEHQVFAALEPWLRAGADRGDDRLTFALANALGERAYAMPDLQALIQHAVEHGTTETVRRAVQLWLADPRHRDERVEAVLAVDVSACALPPVMRVLCYRRTDLLDRVFGAEPPFGRFLSDQARWVPRVAAAAMARWTPDQHAAYARLLGRVAASEAAHSNERVAAIRTLARVPGHGLAGITPYLRASDVVLAEAALTGLAWTDQPGDALPVLFENLGGDRARIAAYAAGRAARFLPPSQFATALRDALDGEMKVTSRKELIRLAARLSVPDVMGLVTEIWTRPNQHRDVRAACVRAAVLQLGDERSWRILREVLDGDDGTESVDDRRGAAQETLRVTPYGIAEQYRARYAELIVAACGHPAWQVRNTAFLKLPHWTRWTPDAARVAAAAVADLANRVSWRTAAVALSSMNAQTAGASLTDLIDVLAAADRAPDTPNAAAERDRPARRRLESIAGTLAMLARRQRSVHGPLAEIGVGALAVQPEWHVRAARLLVDSMDLMVLTAADSVRVGAELVRAARLHDDRMAAAVETATALGKRLEASDARWQPALLLPVASELATAGRVSALMATAVVRVAANRGGWPADWRALLRELRRHADPDVRDAALSVSNRLE